MDGQTTYRLGMLRIGDGVGGPAMWNDGGMKSGVEVVGLAAAGIGLWESA